MVCETGNKLCYQNQQVWDRCSLWSTAEIYKLMFLWLFFIWLKVYIFRYINWQNSCWQREVSIFYFKAEVLNSNMTLQCNSVQSYSSLSPLNKLPRAELILHRVAVNCTSQYIKKHVFAICTLCSFLASLMCLIKWY